MADRTDSIFADIASQEYEQRGSSPFSAQKPQELSPFQQSMQKRQFLHPTVQHSIPQQSKETCASPQNATTTFAPKFSLPAHSTSATLPGRPVFPATVASFATTPPHIVTPQLRHEPLPFATASAPNALLSPYPALTPPAVRSFDSNVAVLPGPSITPVPFQQLETKSQRQSKPRKPRKKMTRGRLIRRIVVICSILTIVAVLFSSQANGASGAWTADTLRTIFGPTITAQVESWYLGLSDTTQQLKYKLGGQQVTPPWTIGTSPVVLTTPPPRVVPLSPMPLHSISPFISPFLPGEGVWVPQSVAPAPYSYLPLDAKAFIRPDPSHPYAIVTLLQFDTRFFRLHMVSGTIEPGGPLGHYGTGVIPAADQKGNALLAAFNGGFKYADGQYGLKTNGIVYVPAQPNAATIAVTTSGQIILGTWGVDPRLNSNNPNLVAWRQNASLLINNGTINPLTQDGAAWGGTILNSAYTWRSAIGLTANGTLLYAAGSSLTALTIGQALKAAGAVMAMQTDINPFWVRAFLYSRNGPNTYNIIKLNPAMYGTGTEYLYATERDFFYLTRFALPPPPPVVHPHETASQ